MIKYSKGYSLVIIELTDEMVPKMWLIGVNGSVYRYPEKEVKIISYDRNRKQYTVINKDNFYKIKENKSFTKELFPYDKEFEDLESLELND